MAVMAIPLGSVVRSACRQTPGWYHARKTSDRAGRRYNPAGAADRRRVHAKPERNPLDQPQDRTVDGVLFDLGGVVMDSPLHAIARYERDHGLPANAVNHVVAASGETGAWARLER